MSQAVKDYYEILGVNRDATKEEIKKAYRKLVRIYHPDINPDPSAQEKFKEINEAYHVLIDDERRSEYDAILSRNDVGKFRDFLEYIQEFVESIIQGEKGKKRRPRKGQDIKMKLPLTLEEAGLGCEKEIIYSRWMDCPVCEGMGVKGEAETVVCHACNGEGRRVSGIFNFPRPCSVCKGKGFIVKNPCPTCYGRGRVSAQHKIKVHIPPGTEEGEVLKVPEKGHLGYFGGKPGDLYLKVVLKEHPIFKKVGKDLHMEKVVSFPLAVLGGTVKVPTLEGEEIDVFIQPGTECGATKVVKEKGYPYENGRGDLIIHIRIGVPKNLSKSERKLLEKLAESIKEEGEEVYREGGSLVEKLSSLFKKNA
ncbi:DnaJ C-terminal domain-containing protein [Aquifex aeolicus]|uniref:Chaperone protein DnaJ 1 n=1 Tax=Aquifex aeolicus (strain VF5) TaxID=224324 RepID=DNAJ1_AQUAE|nr:J domain-containing protein [Aquifex aeolicus]O67623.1 RecName: Full=Chaperone protein DnaJ 1 [Aquifex aeolicus VF5]AAC07578.1 chaperone DnaJ [Aquifex aeolicus VF5]